MTTGTANVNSLAAAYRLATLIPLLLFALYDYRHHLIRNAALLAFLPWCLLYFPVSLLNGRLPVGIICESLLGFLAGGALLLMICLAPAASASVLPACPSACGAPGHDKGQPPCQHPLCALPVCRISGPCPVSAHALIRRKERTS